MPRRAFSLLEVLIAIAVVGAIAGVVFANLSGWTGRSRFESAERRVESAAAMARAEAMREGRALALVAVERNGATALELEPFESVTESEVAEEGDARRDGARPRARVLLELPAGVRVTASRPRMGADAGDPLRPGDAADSSVSGESSGGARAAALPERLTVCVLLPDGSAWGEAVRYVVGPGERLAEVRVSAWTGTARVVDVAWPAATDDAAPAGEERPLGRDGA